VVAAGLGILLAVGILVSSCQRGVWSGYEEVAASDVMAEVKNAVRAEFPPLTADAHAAAYHHRWTDVVLRFQCQRGEAVKWWHLIEGKRAEAIDAVFFVGRAGKHLDWWRPPSGCLANAVIIEPRAECRMEMLAIALQESDGDTTAVFVKYRRP